MAVSSDHVIKSLREQLSEAHLRIAVLEAQLMEIGLAQASRREEPEEANAVQGG